MLFATKDFQKSRFGNKKPNLSNSMITMTFQSCPNDEMKFFILENNLIQPFKPILQQ